MRTFQRSTEPIAHLITAAVGRRTVWHPGLGGSLAGVVSLLVWLLAAPPLAAQPVAIGGQFQVNSYVTGLQVDPEVAVGGDGRFTVVWRSSQSAGEAASSSVQARRYSAGGVASGSQFAVNSHTPGEQLDPRVAIDGAGGLVVAWEGNSLADYAGISVRRFNSSGVAAGNDLVLNSYTTGDQADASVAAAPGGNFVVVWTAEDGYVPAGASDTDDHSVRARRVSSSGTPQGASFQVNTYTTSRQFLPDVGFAADGSSVVVWQSNGAAGDTSSGSVQAQRYAANGSPIGGQILVNTYTQGSQGNPSVDVAGDGRFVVVWQDGGPPGDGFFGVVGRRFASGGSPVGAQFGLNTYTAGLQTLPDVAILDDGRFVAVWQSGGSLGNDDDSWSVQMRSFSSTGVADGPELQVNTYTAEGQDKPRIEANGSGSTVVVTWQSDMATGDLDAESVHARRYSFGGAIFADGFESGSTSAWSSTVP